MTMILPIQVRTDIDANWNLWNPILKKWEVWYSSDWNNYKVGDWVTDWITLPNAFQWPWFKFSWNDGVAKAAQTWMRVWDKGYQADSVTIYEYDGTTWNTFAVLTTAFRWVYSSVALRDADTANLTAGDLVLTDWLIQKYNGTWFISKTSTWAFNNIVANTTARDALTWLNVWDAVLVKDEWIVYEWDWTVFNPRYDITPVTKKVYADIATMNADAANLTAGDLVTNKEDWLIYKSNWTIVELTVKVLPIRETLTNVPDWVITLFSTSSLAQWNVIDVYMNWVLQEEWFDYTKVINGLVYDITFTVAPLTWARLRTWYLQK